jgi:hypothetical protein
MRKTAVILAIFVAISSIVVAADAPPIPGQDTDTADNQDQDQEAPPIPEDSEESQTNNSQSEQGSTTSDNSFEGSGGFVGVLVRYLAVLF